MSSLEVLADNREGFLKYYYDFRRTGMEEAEKEPVRQYILPPGTDPGRTQSLVELCLRHNIEVYRAAAPFPFSGPRLISIATRKRRTFPAGTYIIPLKQPQKRLLKALFEPDPKLEDRFLQEVRATMERNRKLGTSVPKEPLWFYDITAWSLPVTYGLVEAAFSEDVTNSSAGDPGEQSRPSHPAGKSGGKAAQAYLFSFCDRRGGEAVRQAPAGGVQRRPDAQGLCQRRKGVSARNPAGPESAAILIAFTSGSPRLPASTALKWCR